MATAPYATGDRIQLVFDGVRRSVVVGAVIGIPAPDPLRRWRLLCRDEATGASIDLPVYCGDDGHGELLLPAEETSPGVAQAT